MDAPKDDDPRLAEIARGLVDDDPGFAARLERLGEDLVGDRDGTTRLRAITAWFIAVSIAVLLFLGILVKITGSVDAPPTGPTPGTTALSGQGRSGHGSEDRVRELAVAFHPRTARDRTGRPADTTPQEAHTCLGAPVS